MSSCPKKSEEKVLRERREDDVLKKMKAFLKRVCLNLCIYDGVTGRMDMAFKVDRNKIVIQALREVADEIKKETD